jgi:hypothetical protein
VIGKAFLLILFVGLGLLTIQCALPGQDKPEVYRCDTTAATFTQSDISDINVEIRRLVHTYVQSIVNADTKLGATVWSPTPDVSFIEPRGNEQGWEQIAAVFYGKTMGETFTKRTLKLVGDVNIQVVWKCGSCGVQLGFRCGNTRQRTDDSHYRAGEPSLYKSAKQRLATCPCSLFRAADWRTGPRILTQ